MTIKNKKFILSTFVNVSFEDLIDNLNDKDAVYLIKLLDKVREDYGFTEKLAVYFVREMLGDDEFSMERLTKLINDKKYKV